MAVPYHTHTFEIPTATDADVAAGVRSDVAVVPSNLGTASQSNVEDFATSSQGALADTSLQPSDVGTGPGTVAAGDDTRITGAAQKSQNLADLADAATARANLELGSAAVQDASYFATAASVPAEAAKRIVEFDIRMSQFAGGAPMNGVDDDQPAFQAAVDYCKTLGGRYTGGAGLIRIPRGEVRLGSSGTLTGADNIQIVGGGDGVTTLKVLGNYPALTANDSTSTPLLRLGVKGLTIEGPGPTFANAHGIRLGPNNNCEISARVWSCRRAISLANSWQTTLDNIRADGIGSLANHIGIYLEDGDPAVQENAVLVRGGVVQGCASYGIRGENISGSKIFGLEVVGCGDTGVYLGDSPSGKDLKWFAWVGGLIDTCPNLLAVRKGSSTVATLIHFSGMWLGFANAVNGVGVEFNGLTKSTISADIAVNCVYAANIQGCEKVAVNLDTIDQYDRTLTSSVAIICNNTLKSRFNIGTTSKASGSPATVAFVEQGTSNYNLITGVFDGAITTIGANTIKTGAIQVP